jgi:DNA-directed RNA polymerase specialized sigma24 family protein
VVRGPAAHARDAAYRALYQENFRLVLGYALRRTTSAEDAADVTAETMLIAWRRLPEVPEARRACGCMAWPAASWRTIGGGRNAAIDSACACGSS